MAPSSDDDAPPTREGKRSAGERDVSEESPREATGSRARSNRPIPETQHSPVDMLATQAARPSLASGRPTTEMRPEDVPEVLEPSMPRPATRLEHVVLLAEGGMGEVHRARDTSLNRNLAMKVLHAHLSGSTRLRARFLDEAQITAQLAHPSIPPVHEVGELADGRPYFTMKEVHGRTLAALLDADDEGFGEQRRLEVFQRVCEAIAYAHARGVIHCDLKPMNVMVGAFGEVLVMDWGVARLVGAPVEEVTGEPPVTISSGTTTSWEIVGTPAYMPPEQALSDLNRMGPPADVYAMGVMLYELLAGERPYQGNMPRLVFLASQGEVPPLPRRPGSIVDDSLDEIISRAMRPEPADRYADAGELGADIARWRDGALRREKALAVVKTARARLPQLVRRRHEAEGLRREARDMLDALSRRATVDDKRDAWVREDEAALIEREVAAGMAEIERLLEEALVHAPGLPEARELLAQHAFERHRDAERRRAFDEAVFHEVALRAHDVGVHAEYLSGHASLSFTTSVPCEVRLWRHVLRDRQMVHEAIGDLGRTPIVDRELPIGSYLLELIAEGRPRCFVPVSLRRRDGWSGRRPREEALWPVKLPGVGDLAEGEVWVPEGACELGDDDEVRASRWVEAFVARRDPVKFAELFGFLASPEGASHRETTLRDGLGTFRHDWPAVGVSWDTANAYARWVSKREGKRWRLPSEAEWEKLARGVDGRRFPWGDFGDAALCHVRTERWAPRSPSAVDAFATDRSPYGARGLAGNVREWTADLYLHAGLTLTGKPIPRAVRGGSYRLPIEAARAGGRAALAPAAGYVDVGFRLVRDVSW
ncbi:MAG: SUMF1/EgtB/PvdO family nonheme iron enzyme [Sandaracinus sp.]|nr:SUMF1/EgtB/PvdO family nonheme iron enzyme [Sandaracinus sp.]